MMPNYIDNTLLNRQVFVGKKKKNAYSPLEILIGGRFHVNNLKTKKYYFQLLENCCHPASASSSLFPDRILPFKKTWCIYIFKNKNI